MLIGGIRSISVAVQDRAQKSLTLYRVPGEYRYSQCGEVTMATLTTQSIGVVGTQIYASQFQANQVRATEVAQAAGVLNKTQAEALKNPTKVREDKKRGADSERVEGTFADQEIADSDVSQGTHRLNKTA